MKYGVVLIALFLVLLTGTACSPQTAANSAPADVQMAMRVEPDPPAVGSSTLIITLTDSNGAPVGGAALQVRANMDHEGMMPVESQSSSSADGAYHVPLSWTMGGGWIVTVTAQLPNDGGEVSDTFELFVEAMSSQSIINQQSHDAALENAPELTAEHDMD